MDSEPVGMFRKSAALGTPSYHEDAVPLYRHAQPVVPDDVQRDAKRWRALLEVPASEFLVRLDSMQQRTWRKS
jgi:hypothetical protein